MSSKKILSVSGLILFMLIVAGCTGQTAQNIDESEPHGHSDEDAHE